MPKKKKPTQELQRAAPSTGLVRVPARLDEARDPAGVTTAKDLAPFTRLDGQPLPAQEAWGALPYAELGPMFLDQFLLRYFLDILKQPESAAMNSGPWQAFVEVNPWAK